MKNNQSFRPFLILWATQSLSQLGSSITSFALSLWLYEKTGSSLSTAALTICSYAPYVLLSIFAGALTDRWDKRKTMLVCDSLAALSTLTVFLLYRLETLSVWHLYAVNVLSGLMNTVQQPASEVAMTLLVPRESYQRASGLQSLSRSLNSILNPLLATALYTLGGLELVIGLDLSSFLLAFSDPAAGHPSAGGEFFQGRKHSHPRQGGTGLPAENPHGLHPDPLHVRGESGGLGF